MRGAGFRAIGMPDGPSQECECFAPSVPCNLRSASEYVQLVARTFFLVFLSFPDNPRSSNNLPACSRMVHNLLPCLAESHESKGLQEAPCTLS